MIDAAAARETFEASEDLTVGIEEEFALVDPETLLLVPLFERLRDAAAEDPVLNEAIAGELISSEIEIRSGRGVNIAEAHARQRDRRRRLFGLAARHDVPPPAGAGAPPPPATTSRSPPPARTRSRTTASNTSSIPSTTTGSRRASST